MYRLSNPCRSIKRVIFETLVKRVPGGLKRLSVPEIKQIGGRAGRYRPSSTITRSGHGKASESNAGLVTSLEEIDLPHIHEAMDTDPGPLDAAGIWPPDPVFFKFGAYFPPNVPFNYIMKRLLELAQVNPLFFMCNPSGQLEISDLFDGIKGLSVEDRLTIIAAPITTRNDKSTEIALAFGRCVAENSGGRLLDIEELPLQVLEKPVSAKKEYLQELIILHQAVILYSWLSFRFGGVFTDRTLAAHVKQLAEERMIRALTEFSAHKELRKDASLRRQISLQKQIQERERLLAESREEAQVEESIDSVDLSAEEASQPAKPNEAEASS